MHVRAGNGVEVTSGERRVLLDPKRASDASVVSHAHSDHLTPGAHMTPPTLDFLRVRRPRRTGIALPLGERVEVDGISVRLHDAGHVLGGAMVEVETPEGRLLYTGDFNPQRSLTCEGAQPVACDVLVTESTYGDPRFDLPPRGLVLQSLEAWMLRRLLDGPVALGAHPLGRAQELIRFANLAGITPVVTPDVAALSAVYNAHGHALAFAVAGTERGRDLDEAGGLHIVPKAHLKTDSDFARGLRARGGSAALLSGWCHRYAYFGSYAIDAQFALSDHADFSDLVAFAENCGARRIHTTHGAKDLLAKELRRRGMNATPLA